MLQKIILLCAAALLILSGCSFVGSTESLLVRPQMTEEQRELDEALRDSAGSNISLKYPQRGEHLSGFVFFKQRTDEPVENHVAVFYARTNLDTGVNDVPMVAFMARDEAGRWNPSEGFGAPDGMQDVDFVRFRPMVNTDYNNIIVGWSSPRGERRIVIYQIQADSLVPIFTEEYSECIDEDVDGDGLYELFLVTATPQNAQVKMVRQQAQVFGVTAEVSLGAMHGYRQVRYGMLTESSGAIFIDHYTETDEGRRLDTKVVTVDAGLLDSDPLAEVIFEEWGFYGSFLRPADAAVCDDIDGSGTMEIPVVSYMPGYTGDEPTGSILLTDYVGISPGGGPQKVLSAVINQRSGYMFILPSHWLYQGGIPSEPKVTVHNNSSWDEWSFYVYQGSKELSFSGVPLLRIRVVSSQNTPADLLEQGYEYQGYRGLFEYYIQIPEGSEATDIPIEAVDVAESLFRVLK